MRCSASIPPPPRLLPVVFFPLAPDIRPQPINLGLANAVVVQQYGLNLLDMLSRLPQKRQDCVFLNPLAIEASHSNGFDDATIRTISENSRTLKFKHHGFEEE